VPGGKENGWLDSEKRGIKAKKEKLQPLFRGGGNSREARVFGFASGGRKGKTKKSPDACNEKKSEHFKKGGRLPLQGRRGGSKEKRLFFEKKSGRENPRNGKDRGPLDWKGKDLVAKRLPQTVEEKSMQLGTWGKKRLPLWEGNPGSEDRNRRGGPTKVSSHLKTPRTGLRGKIV